LGGWSPPEARAAVKVNEGVTVREYAEKWLPQRDLTPETHAIYRELLKSRIYPGLGDEMLRAVTPATVRAWWVGPFLPRGFRSWRLHDVGRAVPVQYG
jgi:hypothetical protein